MIDPDTRFAIATAPARRSLHWKQGWVTWGEIAGWMKTPASKKESGNYVLGELRSTSVIHKPSEAPCHDVHRRKNAVVQRSGLVLDVDRPDEGFIERFELLHPWAAMIHTTYSSTPSEPRYRVIMPTNRALLPDEYVAACHAVMNALGPEQFDLTSAEASRYMFKPAARKPGWFEYWEIDGALADVDALLADFDADLANKPLPKPNHTKRDPFDLEGTIGAFNRAYADLQTLVETYDLPYERAESERWQLVGSRSVAGMGEMAPGLFYSHHANDPAYGKTCTAFDLVRVHYFGELDEAMSPQTPVNRLPSHEQMLDLASRDARVVAELVGVDFADDLDDTADDSSWRLGLRISNRTGKLLDHIDNWDLISANEPALKVLYFNEMNLTVEASGDLPWRSLKQGGKEITSMDRTAMCHHIEREYGLRPSRQWMDGVMDVAAMKRPKHPVREYLTGLKWDGVERMETCLPGVEPTTYTRLVARKSLVAAVARIFEPGVKWDHTLVLYGAEGLGKSFWIDQMSKGFSATLGRIGDKDTLLAMQRSWIMVSDEGHSLRKSDADATKEFLTRREDVFRMPYDREAKAHKRHCVIWGTTNDEVFLRRQEGNRRFLIVHCSKRADFEKIRDEFVDQVWAEAVEAYLEGEVLHLAEDEALLASAERENFIEEDAMAGIIHEYLDTLVPPGWNTMDPEERTTWLANTDDPLQADGTEQINQVCSSQVWVEAMRRRIGDHTRMDLLEISKALRRLGWKAMPGRERVPGYGPQIVFVRPDSERFPDEG